MLKKALSIAGSDSSGGGGIQADLKTFEEYGVFGFSAVTSIVTMDPEKNWALSVTALEASLVEKQLQTIFTGGPLAAMKTGMLGSTANIEVTRHYIDLSKQKNLVVDPVMSGKGTDKLLQPENIEAIKMLLLPVAAITTPNLREAGILSGLGTLRTIDDMKKAAEKIFEFGPQNVVVKGGKGISHEKAVDVFFDGSEFTLLENEKLTTAYNHGAGCTFAAAITAGLAKNLTALEAVKLAKEFVFAAISEGIEINRYLGHVWHGAYNHAEKRMTD